MIVSFDLEYFDPKLRTGLTGTTRLLHFVIPAVIGTDVSWGRSPSSNKFNAKKRGRNYRVDK